VKATLQKEVLRLEKLLLLYLRECKAEQLKNISSIPGLGKRPALHLGSTPAELQ
jgi:hypothetical protein